MTAFEAAESPTRCQINALLVSALQAHVTLFRMSRVFSERAATKHLSLTLAVRHSPTVALACELRRCWSALGVADSTLKAFLQLAVVTIGSQTRTTRVKFFLDLMSHVRRGIDPKAQKALAAEGSGEQSTTLRNHGPILGVALTSVSRL